MKKLNLFFSIFFFILLYAYVGFLIIQERYFAFKLSYAAFLFCYFGLLCYLNRWSLPWNGKKFKKIFSLSLNVFLMVSILSLLNYLGHKNQWYKDITKQGVNNLTEFTQEALLKIDKPLQIKVFAQKSDWPQIMDLMYLYRSKQSRIKHSFINIEEHPELVQKYNIQSLPTMVYSYGNNHLVGTQADEGSVTKKILRVIGLLDHQVCWFTGGGSVSPLAKGRNGGSYLRRKILDEGYDFKVVEKLDSSCDVFLVLGVKPEEKKVIALLKEIKKKKNVIFAFDPDLKSTALPETWKILEEDGVVVHNHVVVDQKSQKETGQAVNLQVPYGEALVLLPLSTSFELLNKEVKTIFRSSSFPFSWSESNLGNLLRNSEVNFSEKEDLKGPVTLAGIIKKEKSRIAFLGTSLFLSNAYRSYSSNFSFFLNLLSEVLGENTSALNRPSLKKEQMHISTSQFNLVIYLSLIIAPISFLLIAFLNYRLRKKA